MPPVLNRRRVLAAAGTGLGLAVLVVLSTCSPPVSTLERIQALKKIRVATLNSPTTYYVGVSGPTGFEYDLARGLADHLGVELEMVIEDSAASVEAAVLSGRAQVGAAALQASDEPGLRATPAVRRSQLQVVYRSGVRRPRDWSELSGRLVAPVEVPLTEKLRANLDGQKTLQWSASEDEDTERLLTRVARGQLDYTVAGSDLVAITQRYRPELRVAFAADEPHDLVWVLSSEAEDFFSVVAGYLSGLGEKELSAFNERHFGHIGEVNVWNAASLAEMVKTRLPKYRADFEAAGKATDQDWRLIAAVGYQESHWDPNAVSPTMVRGLMQITTATAEFLKIDRLDPTQSIAGAARYLVYLKSQIPAEVPEPDRSWMTLAAYNMGVGHLNDARALTTLNKGDANRWIDVRRQLPLLTQPKWFNRTKYGYARGFEAMAYVSNIRSYYDMLVWITEGQKGERPVEAEEPELPPLIDEKTLPLNLDSPVL